MLYGYALAYLVAPETFTSANVIELVHGLPEAVKYAGKTILAAPFAFHSLNGLRHLAWDSGRCTSVLLGLHVTSLMKFPLCSPDLEGSLLFGLRCTGRDRYHNYRPRLVVNDLSGLEPLHPLLFRAYCRSL